MLDQLINNVAADLKEINDNHGINAIVAYRNLASLVLDIANKSRPPTDIPDVTNNDIHDRTIKTMCKVLILAVLKENTYNLSRAAKILGISRPTLYRKMVEYGINSENEGTEMAPRTTN
jgi:transcriptional regulator with PAS, ATPase and Fis domain